MLVSETAVRSNVDAVREYYRRADAGSPDLIDLFADDFQFYFPKFGVGRGKAEFGVFAGGLLGSLTRIAHDMDRLSIIDAGPVVAVEGITEGALADGGSWRGGETPGGRFASVFEFDAAGLIRRMHVYLDPDYAGRDDARFLWGKEGRRW